jgi:hypothetical protein
MFQRLGQLHDRQVRKALDGCVSANFPKALVIPQAHQIDLGQEPPDDPADGARERPDALRKVDGGCM